MGKIFISQEVLDTLFANDDATLEGDRLTLKSKGNKVYKLSAAFKILRVEGEGADPNDMVGKIFTKAELDKISADAYMDSVLVNETAYQAQQGFVGVEEGAAQPEKPKDDGGPSGGEGEPRAEADVDSDMLSDYLLKIL